MLFVSPELRQVLHLAFNVAGARQLKRLVRSGGLWYAEV